jgi:hypothetical protein
MSRQENGMTAGSSDTHSDAGSERPPAVNPNIDETTLAGLQSRLSGWDEFKDKEFANWKRVRLAIEHENLLTNHRVTWLLSTQGFIFAAFFVAYGTPTRIPSPNPPTETPTLTNYEPILVILAIMGIVISLWLATGIRAAAQQHDHLVKWWKQQFSGGKPPLTHPDICGEAPVTLLGARLPYYVFGLIFSSAWLTILAVVLSRYLIPYTESIIQITVILFAILSLFLIGYYFGSRKTNRLGANSDRSP